jgi:hypothetical protein
MSGSTTAPDTAAPLHVERGPQRHRVSSPLALSGSEAAIGDRGVIALLSVLLVALLALTWRRWGILDTDTGLELTIADAVSHGAVPYRDVRYFYGPAGLYSLALMFKVFGASLSTAIAFGLAETVAILATFYALARNWVRPASAGLATAALIAVGLSGWANFVLPNTNSASIGLLFLLLVLLALTRRRPLLAGVALGLLALTRVEFAAAGAAVAVAYALGIHRAEGRRAALRALGQMVLPAVLIAGPILGLFAAEVGLSRLVTQNLFPVSFLHSEATYQQSLSPLTFSSLVVTVGRGLVYAALLAGVVGSALLWPREGAPAGSRTDAPERSLVGEEPADSPRADGSEGLRVGALARLRALWPLAAAVAGLLLLDGASRALGAFPGSRALIQTDCKRLLIGMSWLPALVLVAAIWALVRFARRKPPLLSDSWALDLALLAATAVLSLRAYDNFTTDTFAPYYAAPLLLLAAILHQRIGDRRPAARGASLAVFAVVVVSLVLALDKGTTAGQTQLVRSARGEFATTPAAAPALQRTIDFVRAHARPSEPILSLPYGGLYFLVDRPPALYNLAFLPGDVASTTEQRAAIAELQHERVRYVVLGNARFVEWGKPQIGVDYDLALLAFVDRTYRVVASYGDFGSKLGGPLSQAYKIYERR